MARKIECSSCGSLNPAGTPCRCYKHKSEGSVSRSMIKDNVSIAKKFYQIGITDAECGLAYYKSDNEIEAICNKLT